MREKQEETKAEPLSVYESHPPEWLPKIHGTANLGYIGFHPPRPGQDEDSLSETNVKNGFILAQPVAVESFSAHSMINENLQSPEILSKLEHLMNEVFVRRAERIPPVPTSTFRIPTRVTLNDAKRQAWFADLANPDVPLYKLGKSVPHGAKGHDLLDLLHTNNVEISRAVWFLRVFGVNETAGLRNKPSYVPTQYSIDWANMVTSYMKKQLQGIALPSAPRLHLNVKQTFKAVLADTDTREQWISRFTYCLKLLRAFYAEDLVDHRTFLVWLVQQMATCNLAQACFLARLSDEYLEEIVASRALAKPLVDVCLSKLLEIRTTFAKDFLKDTEDLIRSLLQKISVAIPDAFINPKSWSLYAPYVDELASEGISAVCGSRLMEQSFRDLDDSVFTNLTGIKKRNEALLFRYPVAHVSARVGTAVSDIKLLNAISGDTDISSVSYFGQDINDPGFREKLDMLLTWSVTPLQYGDHRPFAAVSLIRIWRDKARDRASRRDISTPSEFLQDQLFDWLDTSEVAGDSANIRYVALLYGKLVKHGIFSYASYIQRLIARGEMGLSNTEQGSCSRHRLFLSWIPLLDSAPSLIHQRKAILHGLRIRDVPEDATEREIRKEIRSVMPDLFEGQSPSMWTSRASLLDKCMTLMKATRFEQVRTFRQWLLPVFKQRVKRISAIDTSLFKCYLIAIELMSSTQCFHSALDLTLSLLEQANDADSMNSLINTLCRFSTIWTCMDTVPVIVSALDMAQQAWKLRGHVPSRHLLSVLMQFDNGRYLSDSSREQITSSIASFTLALQPVVEQPDIVPDFLPEILLLAAETDPNAPSALANGLWIKYRTSMDWAWKVWDNTIASLRQIPTMTSDLEARHACAIKYADFLWKVDEHLPHGLDQSVLDWLLGPMKAEIVALDGEAWEILKTVLLFLVVRDALKTTTLLQGIVYPAWQLCANRSISETYLSAANSLCFQLLLPNEANVDAIPPTDLFEVQCIQTRRQSVYDEPHFPLLVENIPALISLENNNVISAVLRQESTSLRCRICQESGFRRGAYRNLDLIRNTFENSQYFLDQDPSSGELSKRAIAGLKIILCDSTDDANLYDWPEVTCLLTPWKIAATTIQMQLQLKQLGRALSHEFTAELAAANMNKLASMLFHHIKTAEEAYYVGEMAQGVDCIVASKFLNSGFQCITELLSDEQTNRANMSDDECIRRAGELQSVLIHISQPFRDTSSQLSVDSSVHEAFTAALDKRFKNVEETILKSSVPPHTAENLNISTFSRLLQFILSFKSTWTPSLREIYLNLSQLFFRFALHFGSGDTLDINIYPTIIDTLLVLYDEIQADSKLATLDPYRHYAKISLGDIPQDMPPEYRRQILSLLANAPSDAVVTDLVSTHRDKQGKVVLGSPVVNKPWEWVENLGETPIVDPKEEKKEREEKERLKCHYLVKNSGSISLEHFNARLSGDGVKQSMVNEPIDISESEYAGVVEGCIRTFGDGLSENIFIRDWRESRLESELSPNLRGDLEPDGIGPSTSQGMNGPSPTSSVISRSSTQTTVHSQRQQPSPSHSSLGLSSSSAMHEVIDVDSLPASATGEKGSKRKASTTISDDEVEIIEGPFVVRSQTGSAKKPKAAKAPPPSTSRARKR
ncbi:hypothetical protein CPC08DRAFT_813741 [Agrocybe pediades]|nr:hypothetical protein CPC08DRAFT_813741 [Agrocybe pediades]